MARNILKRYCQEMPWWELMFDVRDKEIKEQWGDFFLHNHLQWNSGRPFSKEDYNFSKATYMFINRQLYLTYGISNPSTEVASSYCKIDSPQQLLRKIKEHLRELPTN